MWFELIIGIIIFQLLRRFFSNGDDLDVGTYPANAIFSVAKRLEQLYGGKAYVGLRIPDADSGSPQNIDIVLVTQREAAVISVKNVSGFVSVDKDGNWECMGGDKHKTERLPDPVAETKELVPVLESYFERRGVSLLEGYLSCKVICPNPNFRYAFRCSGTHKLYAPAVFTRYCFSACFPFHRTIHADTFPPEVITYDQWIQLKPEKNSLFSGWMKGAFHGGKKEMQESIHESLNSILSTAPMWDRLKLKSNKSVLGEFVEFKGHKDDLLELRNIKRSKVSRLTIQKTSMFGLDICPKSLSCGAPPLALFFLNVSDLSHVISGGLKFPICVSAILLQLCLLPCSHKASSTRDAAHSKLQVLYSPRDYHGEGASGSEWNEVCVRSSTEVVFQPQGSSKAMAKKMLKLQLPDGTYIEVPENYSDLDLLAEVCTLDREKLERLIEKQVSLPSLRIPNGIVLERPRASSSKGKGVVDNGIRSWETKDDNATNQTASSSSHHQGPNTSPAMPIEFRNKIVQLAGPNAIISDEILLIQKSLTSSDVRKSQNRLSIPGKQIGDFKFLTDEEERLLSSRNGKNVGSLDNVMIIEPSLEASQVSFRRWDMDKDNGSRSSSYVITKTWNGIKERNQLEEKMVVQVWALRVGEKLWLVLVRLPD
nr:Plasma membrane isoform 1 [Ipomoea batatas]